MMESLAPRGELEEVLCEGGLLAGVQRLRVVGGDRAVQPWVSADGRWVLCYNGVIFNYRELRAELTGLRRRLCTYSDTEVVLEAFLQWAEDPANPLRPDFALSPLTTSTRPPPRPLYPLPS